MRTQKKVLVREKIPGRFIEIIKHVAILIAHKDESTTIESDDLLQDEKHDYCGGLIDPEKRLFFFAFNPDPYVEDDPEYVHAEWRYVLCDSQIARIASGDIVDLDMWRCNSGNCKHRHEAPDDYCNECDSE